MDYFILIEKVNGYRIYESDKSYMATSKAGPEDIKVEEFDTYEEAVFYCKSNGVRPLGKIKAITIYQTTDGEEFDGLDDAIVHQKSIEEREGE